MTSSGPDRSIASISLPQWMKSKISDRYDLEQTAFSPPSNDDGFFLVRYKKALPEQADQPNVRASSKLATVGNELEQSFEIKSHLDQHTAPCQKFISDSKIAPREIGMRHGIETSLGRIKSTGTDDGFKGEGACGYSVVAVAHQMIAERTGDNNLAAPPMNQRIRRNSKSLPASPQSSPKLLRKNPYFTNIIFGSSEIVDNENNSIMRGSVEELGKWATVSRKLGEEGEITNNTSSSRSVSSSVSSTTMTTSSITGQLNQSQQPQQLQQQILKRQLYTPPPSSSASAAGSALGQIVSLKAKPSHLREMNFWSPTSM